MFAKLILGLLGWKEANHSTPNPEIPCIIIAYPHTCYYDGILTTLLTKIRTGHLALKADFIFFRFCCWLTNAIPIYKNRGSQSQSDQITEFLRHNNGHLYVSPEGSRPRASKIRSGFYHIARKSGRPIVCGNFDYRTKEYSFSEPFEVRELTFEDTVARIGTYYRDAGLLESGKHPERTTPFEIVKSD